MTPSVEEKMLLARIEDAVNLCERQNCIKAVGFLTPADAGFVKRHMPKSMVKTCFFGGYPDAERVLFAALPDYLEEDDAAELLSVIEITGRDIGELKHPDFLGSLLGLGIKREKLGDILCFEDRCIVFAAADIADFIISNLDKVGRCGVKVSLIEPKNLIIPKRKFEEICTTVASLRLDAVIGAALKTSRGTAVELIRSKRVAVNWQEAEDVALKLKVGDVFSVRGKGRFRLTDEIRETRKGRLGICIEKYI